jgi:signal peptidase I
MKPDKIKTKYGVILKTNDKLIIKYNDGNTEGFIKNISLDEGIRQQLELFILLSLGICYFNTDITIVDGNSMYPTYKNFNVIIKSKNKDHLTKMLLSKNAIIKFKDPSNVTSIKRIVGVPGDIITFELTQIKVNDVVIDTNNTESPPPNSIIKIKNSKMNKPYSRPGAFATLKLKDDEFFVMGDNKNNSTDSRNYGTIKTTSIISIIKK